MQVVGDSPVWEKMGKTGVGKEEWNGTGNQEDSREDGREEAGNLEGGRECEIGKRKSEGLNYDRGRGRRETQVHGEDECERQWEGTVEEEMQLVVRGGERKVSVGREMTGDGDGGDGGAAV